MKQEQQAAGPGRLWRKISLLAGAALLAAGGLQLAGKSSAAGNLYTASTVAELRTAVTNSNANPGVDTIRIAAGTYNLGSTPLDITDAVNITGSGGDRDADPGATILTASGDRVLRVNYNMSDAFGSMNVEALTISGGQAPEYWGGGGIAADTGNGTLMLYNVVVEQNSTQAASGDGGGLYVSGADGGKLVLDRVAVKNNTAAESGGGLFLEGDLELVVMRSSFEGNTARSLSGGGIAFLPESQSGSGPVRIQDSTFAGNRADGIDPITGSPSYGGNGGGIAAGADNTVIVNSTFSGNTARTGGGGVAAVSPGTLKLSHVTITGNRSETTGGGGFILQSGTSELSNSIVAGNTTGSGPAGSADIAAGTNVAKLDAAASRYNVIGAAADAFASDPAAGGNILNTDPKLLALADNGGFTRTHMPAPDSPVRTAGGPSAEGYDQRGFPRMIASSTAAGAVEGLARSIRYGRTFTQELQFGDASSVAMELVQAEPADLIEQDDLAGSGAVRTMTVQPNPQLGGQATYRLNATRTIAGVTQTISSTLELTVKALPDLTVTGAPANAFYQGQTDAEYRFTVRNQGSAPTSGEVTLALTLPSGFTAASVAGENWTCNQYGTSCSRTTAIAAGGQTEIVVTGQVADQAPSPLSFAAAVSGGGEEQAETSNNSHSLDVPVYTTARVENVQVPTNGVYKSGDALSFVVNYDQAVTVTGVPALLIDAGGIVGQALYTGGTGTKALTFTYTIEAGVNDPNGIAVDSLTLNGGSIKTVQGISATLSLQNVGSTTGVLIDSIAPAVTGVNLPSGGLYKQGDQLDFVVTFDEPVTGSGDLTLTLTAGGQSVSAVLMSQLSPAELLFRYTVAEGVNAPSGLIIGALQAGSGASIRDAAGNNAVLTLPGGLNASGIRIDTKTPELTNLQLPAAGAYKSGDMLVFEAVFDEAVAVSGTPRYALAIGGETRYAVYQSGSGSTTLRFEYQVTDGDNDADGISFAGEAAIDLNGGSIMDGAGHTAALKPASAPQLTRVTIDTASPSAVALSITEGVYIAGDELVFKVRYSEPVMVSGTPKLPFDAGSSGTLQAVYKSGTGTDTLIFTYVLPAGLNDADGITVGSGLQLDGGQLHDAAGNGAELSLPGPADWPNVKIDTEAPVVQSAEGADGFYTAGSELEFTVRFNEPVKVDTAGGTPTVSFTVGGQSRTAAYKSGSGTDALVFGYTVQAGDADGAAVQFAASAAIGLGGGQLTDIGGNPAVLTLAGISAMDQVIVDAVDPGITAVDGQAPGMYKAGDVLEFTLTVSEAVTVSGGTPVLRLQVGEEVRSAVYVPADSSPELGKLIFRYTIVPGDLDLDGLEASGSTIQLGGAAITDAAGNELALNLPQADLSGIKVDTVLPVIRGIDLPAEGAYRAGQELVFTVQLNKPVAVDTSNGTPVLQLTVGSEQKQAVYTAGSGNGPVDELVFIYTIVPGDQDSDGLVIASNLDLQGAQLTDHSGNELQTAITLPGSGMPVIEVDTEAPQAPVFAAADGSVYRTGSPVLTGTAEAGTVVTVRALAAAGSTPAAEETVTAKADGSWSVTLSGLTEGNYTIQAVSADRAGNSSTKASVSISIVPKLELDAASYELNTASKRAVRLYATYADGTRADVTAEAALTIGDETVAVIEGGVLKAIAVGTTQLTVEWQGQTLTADVTIKAAPSTGGGTPGGGGGSPVQPGQPDQGPAETPSASAEVIVLPITVNGRGLTTEVLAEQIKSGKVTVALEGNGPVSVSFDLDVLNKLLSLNKELVVELKSGLGSITIPVRELQQQAQKESGLSAPIRTMTVSITPADAAAASAIEAAVKAKGASIVVQPVDFAVRFDDANGMSHKLHSFGRYMKRTITAAGVTGSSAKAAGMVWDETSGTFRYSPTASIQQTGGRWTVELNDRSPGISFVTTYAVTYADTNKHWAEKEIERLASMMIVNGRGEDTYVPSGSVTRAEFAALLTRVLGLSGAEAGSASFSDVSGGWYEDTVTAAVEAGLVTGYSDGSFRPNATISRQEMAVMMLRAFRYLNDGELPAGGKGANPAFADQQAIKSWANEAVSQAVELGIAKGDGDNNFRPADNATRAEAAVMLLRMMKAAGLAVE
ncbi:hypothetical protein DNH61_17560 [Paenibacillus sambharensis]|uniref:SLH domain-containing protein n=1 Tax=Paenibacillus sambharensis TaxID=1803190 RepID=A0A2W1LHT9_9BACL|nr:S-layer homology domain-containing protein [Paenibacillus sambharensis]PZD94525.1 hypothetical protein DNH61_17560 [Paenibacillus sambharensis]